jgi:hypothetical protein
VPQQPRPAPERPRTDLKGLIPGLTALALGVLMLGPALAPGYALGYDMVFVPHPPSSRAMFGLTGAFPRQVPSDAVIAGLATVLPADLVQKLVLLLIFGLAGWGAARLVPGERLLPRTAAAVFYVWNPYVAERLLLGQWALLLGYAGLPWALSAAVSVNERHGPARLVRSLLPAAVGGFAAMNVSALVVGLGVLAAGAPHRGRRVLKAGAVLIGLALPWLVPALLAGGHGRTDPAGVDLFAARADTPFGSFGSLLSLGGIWNAEVVPPGYGTWFGATGRLVLSLTAIGAFGWALRNRTACTPQLKGLAWAAATGFGVACVGITEPGRALVRGLVGLWPGFGVLRDAHVYLAPLALLEAIGLGFLVLALSRMAVLALIAPIALLPTLAWGMSGRLAAVDYPADWARARTIINGDPAGGLVLDLPWGAYRRFPWNGGRAVLDPLPRVLDRRVVWNDGLEVGSRELAPEDPLTRAVDGLVRSSAPLTAPLGDAGYRYVVLEKVGRPDEAELRRRLQGARPVLDGRDLAIFRLDGSPAPVAEGTHLATVLTADLIAFLLVLWATTAYPPYFLVMRRTGS